MSPKTRIPDTAVNEKEIESVFPETLANLINPTSTPTEENHTSAPTEENDTSIKEDLSVTPEIMEYFLNAYKYSPEYDNLKKKRFNTGFIFQNKRDRDIEIFTPEEINSPKWSENLPPIENKIQGEPGETYANIFMSIPGLSDSDLDEELEEILKTKSKRAAKKGRKKRVGYKGVPLSDK